MTPVELCPKCHASIALTSYKHSFEKDFARGYQSPSQSEASCIEKSLENPSADMAALAQEIKRVELMLDALKEHHAHLDRHIQRSTQYIRSSPIRRLPTEVLGIIFASACTSFQYSEYIAPLSISVVCSKWRDIALSTPSLWTHIYVAPYSGGLDVYEHYLKRCGHIPISVKIDIPYKEHPTAAIDCDENIPYEETYDYHRELVSATCRNCAQWKVAEFCMNPRDTSLLGYHIQELESPLLESLTLVNEGPVDYVEPGLFNEASFLTSFTILDGEGRTVVFRDIADAFPWRQLREVCTQSDVYSLRHHLNVELDHGNNRTLILRPHRYEIDLPFIGVPPFSLRISTLVLDSVIWMGSLLALFRSITIPTLENLTMMPPDPAATDRHFDPADWINPFSVLPEFLARSGCALQTFTVIMRGRYVDDIRDFANRIYTYTTMVPTLADSLVAALHRMKNLRALRVIEAELGPSLFNEQLFPEMAEGHLLPALTSLEMVWAEERQPVDALIPMLCARGGRGGVGMDTLSSVVLGVRNGGALRGDVLDCMANLRQQGIRATLW
ncbi:hypothetical protein BDZ89DRAFT_1158637 [Hymenopellis radicata]|nr:hypothetical protein BDZ89DRAFT_1158637 [Hymenopellis radicata]